MGRSPIVGFEATTPLKIGTILTIDTPDPPIAETPMTVTLSGMLTTTGGEGIPGATIRVFINSPDGAQYSKMVWTNSNPLVGAIGVWWVTYSGLTAPGTYEAWAKFDGDATYEGC